MKRLLTKLSAAVLLMTAVSTAYADFNCCPSACPPSCPMSYSPCCENLFDGFYVGGNVGAIGYTGHITDRDEFVVDAATYTAQDINVVGGVQAGWDMQCNNRVFGIVGDWDWSNAEGRTRLGNNTPGITQRFKHELRWFSTIRLRAGLAVCDTLVYVTGGAVAGRFRNEVRDTTEINPGSRFDRTRWGWTAGFGAEFIFCQSWSLNAEVLYLAFTQHSRSFTSDGLVFNFDFNHNAWVGRIGVNYRFGSLCCW